MVSRTNKFRGRNRTHGRGKKAGRGAGKRAEDEAARVPRPEGQPDDSQNRHADDGDRAVLTVQEGRRPRADRFGEPSSIVG